jgi:hypothetical protein
MEGQGRRSIFNGIYLEGESLFIKIPLMLVKFGHAKTGSHD